MQKENRLCECRACNVSLLILFSLLGSLCLSLGFLSLLGLSLCSLSSSLVGRDCPLGKLNANLISGSLDDNVDFLQNLPLVDTTLFSPDFCILSPTQIYWYYKSHDFDLIELYGCKGDIYKIRRHSPNERFQLMEWIKYKKEETNYK